MEKLQAQKSIRISATVKQVWEAITNPEQIKKYYFGTEWVTDFKKGSPILFRGNWDHETFEDKGNILEIEPMKLLRFNYWISNSQTADIPENYIVVQYELEESGNETIFTVSRKLLETEKTIEHAETFCGYITEGLKYLFTAKL